MASPGAPEGAIATARDTAKLPGFVLLDQYTNEANPDAHFRTTGPEIWRQTEGKITHFIAGLGTCGTITGSGRFLKSKNPGVKVEVLRSGILGKDSPETAAAVDKAVAEKK